MITKAHLADEIEKYEKERSLWKIGLFSACIDCVTSRSVTKFYYELKQFLTSDLADLKLTDQLKELQMDNLRKILKKSDVGFNSTNSAITDLYDNIKLLVYPNPQMNYRF